MSKIEKGFFEDRFESIQAKQTAAEQKEKEAKNKELKDKLDSINAELAEIESKRAKLIFEKEKATAALEEVKLLAEEAQKVMGQLRNFIKEKEGKLDPDVADEIGVTQMKAESVFTKMHELQKQVTELNNILDDLEKQYGSLKMTKENFEAALKRALSF